MKARNIRSKYALGLSELKDAIPSAFAVAPWEKVSSKYAFVSTEAIIEALASEGMGVYSARQSGSRIVGKSEHTKHSLRFRSVLTDGTVPAVGDTFLETVLTNSSDRSSSVVLECGIFKLACLNGATVSIGSLSQYRAIHRNLIIETVLSAVKGIVSTYPQVIETIHRMQNTELSYDNRARFAQLAIGLRYDLDRLPFQAERLLEVRRDLDRAPNLYNVFHVVQENLIQGQTRRTHLERTTRTVRSIDTDLFVNRGLWQLAQSFLPYVPTV